MTNIELKFMELVPAALRGIETQLGRIADAKAHQEQKNNKINILYCVDEEDNTKFALFASACKPTKEMIRKAVSEYLDFEDRFETKELETLVSDIHEKEEGRLYEYILFIDEIPFYSK